MKAIAAVNLAGYIGKGGDLLYSIKEDMRYFASVTRGKTLVMGRKTLLSLPGGTGLKSRTNVVLSRSMSEEEGKARGVMIARDIKGLFALLSQHAISLEDTYVIGGGEIYALLRPHCDTLYITRILKEDEGETRFPDIPSDFRLTEGEEKESDGVRFRFDRYDRIR